MASQQESLQEAREEHEAAHERPVLEVTPDRTELRAVGSAVIKPASEPCRQQFGAPAPINTPSPSSWIPCMPRTCSTARTQHEVGHCSETQHSSPSVGSSLPCGRLGDQAYEPQEAAATCVDATTYANETKTCAPENLSDSSSYSPLKPFELKFSSPDFEKFNNPFKDCPGGYRSLDLSQYEESSPNLTPPPMTSTTDDERNVAIRWRDSRAHNMNAAEPRHSAENFRLPCSVTLRRRRATKSMSPVAFSEFSPINATERVELNPAQATEDEAEESDADEGPWNTASCSGRASTVPKFMSPDITAYPRLIREDIAKCYDAHREWPSSLMDSPASTVSAASDEHNVASSPTAAIPVASKLTPDEDLGRLSAYNPSPIFRPMLDIPHRLSTVIECTETSIKGSPTTTHDEDEAGILHELEKLMALLNEKQAAGAGITAASPQATAEEAARPISPIPRVENRTSPLPRTHRHRSRSPSPGVSSVGKPIEASHAGTTEPSAAAEPERRMAEDELEEAVPIVSEI